MVGAEHKILRVHYYTKDKLLFMKENQTFHVGDPNRHSLY